MRETEALVQQEVQRLRPTIPSRSDSGYLERMQTFDSIFYFRGSDTFNFRGTTMCGWEVNYYFIGMAMAHQGLSWSTTQDRIWQWNAYQALQRGHQLSIELTNGVWVAARDGYNDEVLRLQLPPQWEQMQMRPPGGRTNR